VEAVMKISTKGEYGIRALLELTQQYHRGYVQSATIAAARRIPENYLYQLLITLRKAGVILSRRGPQGGHMLARSPEDITLAQVVAILEGPIAPTECTQEQVVNDCPFGERCPVHEVWEHVTTATKDILEATTFAALAHRENVKRAEMTTRA
jgi:Rrf2 family protein